MGGGGGWDLYLYRVSHAQRDFDTLFPVSDAIAPRRTAKSITTAVLDQNPQKLEELVGKGEGRATLRLKKDGQAVVEQVVS